MPTRILHVSDLHFGTPEDAAIERDLAPFLERARPALVIASGDLTHRGRREQHERAARFLGSFGPPVLAVPGNHDIPYTFPARFTRPFMEFERHWRTTEPVFSELGVHAVGVNSVRPWRHQSGGVGAAALRRACERLRQGPERALRVAVLHHHLIGAPWRSRKKPVARRNHVLAALVDAGAELILAGHIHQAAVSERREFEIVVGGEHGVAVSVAPGLGQPRPSRRGEARGLHVYDVGDDLLRVTTCIWRRGEWGVTAERTFARGRAPLVLSSS